MKRTLYSLAFQVLSVAFYASIVGGIFLLFLGFTRGIAGDGRRIEWLFVLSGASVLLTAIPARSGLRVLQQRWGLTPVDPSAAIRERAFEHWKAARQQQS